jgi:cobalt-zinc-cadmium resistance protein CzcA
MINRIIRFALQARVLVLLMIAGVTGYGAWLYFEIPRDAFPDISPVMVPVFAEAPGMAPEEVERLISIPIENTLSGLPDVTLVKSTSAFGMAVIYVYFSDHVNMYFARQLVAERLATATSSLPAGVDVPTLGPISSGLGQIFIYYLEATPGIDTEGKDVTAYLRELNDFVVKRQLQAVTGVTSILSMGGHILQYQIELDPDRMRKYDIALDGIIATVTENNRNVGGQYIVLGAEEYLVRGIGLLESMEDIRNLPLKNVDGIAVTIADIAEVQYGHDVRRGMVSLNGEREVVAGIVLKLYGENTSKVIKSLHRKIEDIQAGLPKGVKIIPAYDQADLVDNASSTVESALLQGILLVMLLLAVALRNLRAALIVTISMPFSAAAAIICMNIFGVTANLMSLGGIAIALGMLIDGSIIVVDNINRHLNMPENQNKNRLKLIANAAGEVGRPILFALLIVVSVFIPVFMLEGVEGKMFRPLAFSVMAALLASLVAGIVNAPVLASFLMKTPKKLRPGSPLVDKIYFPLLDRAIKLRVLIFLLLAGAVVGSALMLQRIGREFMPTLEEGALLISVTMAPSIGLEQAEKVVRNLEKMILRHPEVVSTVSRVGRPEAGSHPHPVNFAEIQIELKSESGEPIGAETRNRIVGELREELKIYPGITLNFSQPIQNMFEELLSGIKAYFAIKIYGEDLEILRTKADEIRQAVAEVPGIVDLASEQSFGQPQIQVIIDRSKASRHGVSASQIMQMVESAVGGENISSIYRNTRRYDINIRLAEKFRSDPRTLEQLPVKSSDGRTIPLWQIAEIKTTEGPIQINREDNQRRWTVQGNIAGRAPSYIIEDMRRVIAEKIELPAGYFIEFGGQFENQERAMRKLMVIVPAVIGLIFLLLWISFSSLRCALTVMANVPLALIGGIAGLLLTGQLLSVPAAVGFIALFGIAMQDGVVMITDFRDLRAEGMPLREAVLKGSAIRFRSVMLTTLTTLIGLLPLLLSKGIGAEIQRPLAAIVIFGLFSSTMLTLFVLPSLYYEVERHFVKRGSKP